MKARSSSFVLNRVLKCDVTFEITRFVSIFGNAMIKNAYLPKISILLQFGGEILALLCPDDSIQLLLNIWNGDKIRRIYMESSGHNGA